MKRDQLSHSATGVETHKGLLDSLLQRSKANDVVLAGRPNNISIVDYANRAGLSARKARSAQ